MHELIIDRTFIKIGIPPGTYVPSACTKQLRQKADIDSAISIKVKQMHAPKMRSQNSSDNFAKFSECRSASSS